MRSWLHHWLWTMVALVAATAAASAGTVVVDANAIYPEGPLWLNGRLLYVEYGGPGVKVWDGKQSAPYWRGDHCGASGLIAFHGDHLLVACYDANTLVEVDEHGQTVRTIERDGAGKPFIGPNDFTADRRGGIYFSASGVYDLDAAVSGTVLYIAPGGQIGEVANTIHYSNGLTLSKDGQHLLVAEMLAGRILSFPVNADGTLGIRSVWARLRDLAPPTPTEDAYNGPDGLKLGPDGNYYIAQNGSGRVLVVDDRKRLVRIVSVPTPFVTNLAFGADGAKTLYITGVFDQWKAPYPGVVYRVTP